MRLSKFAIAALCTFPGWASANELLNVYELAVQNDTEIAAARYARDAALQAHPQARAALLPSLSASYSYEKGTSEGSSSQESVTGDGQPITLTREFDTDDTNRSLGVTLSQSLFDWSAILRLKQASDQVAIAETTYQAAAQNLRLRAAEAYFNFLSANDDLRYSEAESKAVARQLEQAQRRFDVGLSAITDVQEAQARYDLTVAQVLIAEQALASAREALLEITGQAEASLVTLRDNIPLVGPEPADVNVWLNAALGNNLDLLVAQITAEVASKDVRIARSGHLPTVDLIGRYTNSDNEAIEQSNLVGSSNSEVTGESIGVNVTWPIFSGGLVRSQTVQAQSVEEQRLAELEGSRRSVTRQTRDAYLGVLSGASQVKAFKQAVISNQTALDASETGLEVGTRTAVDVLNAQSLLYSAQRDFARARYDYLLSVLRLKLAAGNLDRDDLAEIDALLVNR